MECKEINTSEVALADLYPNRAKQSFKCHKLAICDSFLEKTINEMGIK